MAIEDGMNGAAGWHFHFTRQSSKEALPDLAGAPVRFLALGGDDGRFELLGQLVCISVGAPGTIREPLQSAFLITLKDLVAGFAGDLKLAAQRGHALPVFEPNHESYAFVHNRTFLPWHPTPAPFQGKKCNPCLRYVLLPMCRAAHKQILTDRPLLVLVPIGSNSSPPILSRATPFLGIRPTGCNVAFPNWCS